MTESMIIWGASGHAMVVADIIRILGEYKIEGFLDSVNHERKETTFCGAYILGGEEQLDFLREQGIRNIIFGFGNCVARLRLAEVVKQKGFHLLTAVHPKSIVASDVKIGAGSVVAAGAVINAGTIVGENVIINTSSSVDHECRIGNGAHICPGAHLAGRVTIGRGAWVGIGATIADHLTIGNASMIGAGALVVRDVPESVLAYGHPAKIKRSILNDF